MPIRILSDLAGTMLDSFRVGVNRLKNVSGVVYARNAADSADAGLGASLIDLRNGAFRARLSGSPSMAADRSWVLPAADGATSQALVTDGAGNLSFITVSTGANTIKAEDQLVAFNSTSPVTIVVLPAGATIQRVTVEVETAFAGGTPSLSVGITGVTSKYMGTNEMDLLVAGIYQNEPMVEEAASVSPIVTYSAGGASSGVARVTVQWALPG